MTLKRVLEPESMSDAAEAWAYGEMALDDVNRCFVVDLLAGGDAADRVIDLGCGPCDIPIRLCQVDPKPRVLAIDSSIEMLELAKRRIDLGGMLDRITLQHADVKALDDFEAGMAELVISNSLLHHLAEPEAGLAAAVRLVQPGGRLFFRDLVRPDSDTAIERLVKRHSGDEPEVAQQLLRQSLAAALTLDEVQRLCSSLGIDPACVAMTSDRHWTLDWRSPASDNL